VRLNVAFEAAVVLEDPGAAVVPVVEDTPADTDAEVEAALVVAEDEETDAESPEGDGVGLRPQALAALVTPLP
jgi:hypothetical protein